MTFLACIPNLLRTALCLLLLATFACGDEFQVPSVALRDQERPKAAQLTSGALVVAWEDESSGKSDIYFRLFNTSGGALSAPILAHAPTAQDQAHPAVTALLNGNFVVAWSSRNFDGSSYGIAFRRFDSRGALLDVLPIQANSNSSGPQLRPQLATLSNGDFVVTFVGQSGGGNQDVYFRRFNSAGAPLDAIDNPVNGTGNDAVHNGDQGSPGVAALKDGGFVIVYEDRDSDDLYSVRFNSFGQPQSAPGEPLGNFQHRLHQGVTYRQSSPAVAGLANGGYVVTFASETNGTADTRRAFARVFTTNGPIAPEFITGSHSNRWESPDVIGLPNGDFVAGWQAFGQGSDANGGRWSVWAQRFASNGVPRIAPFRVNEYDVNHQAQIGLVPFNTSGYGAVWESFEQDGSRDGVFARLFLPNNEIPGRLTIARSGNPANRQFVVSFTGQAGRLHELQATSSSNLNGWATIYSTNPPTGTFDYLENGSTTARKFFRVRSP